MTYKRWFYTDFTNNKKSVIDSNNAGLYIICAELENSKYKAIYVGQAKNLNDRFQQHLSDAETNLGLKKYLSNNYKFRIYYTEESSSISRDRMELYLYNKLTPKFNEQTPPSKIEEEINIPSSIA